MHKFLTMDYLKDKAKDMTEEKAKAIKKRNEALSEVPVNQRKDWAKNHPLEMFY